MDAVIKARIVIMRGWVDRRRAKGEEPTADEIWNRINYSWPEAAEEKRELVFQALR